MSRLLEEAGQALYGDQWQSAIARELQVSDRTVRRWLSGASQMPVGVPLDLLRLVLERAQDLDDVAEKLRAA